MLLVLGVDEVVLFGKLFSSSNALIALLIVCCCSEEICRKNARNDSEAIFSVSAVAFELVFVLFVL